MKPRPRRSPPSCALWSDPVRAALAAVALMVPAAAWADGGGIVVVNRTASTIRSIQMTPAGSSAAGVNRLRSRLPPGAQGRIAFSGGCRADVRLGFDDGRTEEFRNQDACAEARIVTGDGPAEAAAPGSAPARPTELRRQRPGASGKTVLPAKAEVPPWTGHSITKRFGGLD